MVDGIIFEQSCCKINLRVYIDSQIGIITSLLRFVSMFICTYIKHANEIYYQILREKQRDNNSLLVDISFYKYNNNNSQFSK